MKNRHNRAAQCSLSIVIAMLCMATTYAQQQPTPPPIIGYGFDEFHIGGETGYHQISRNISMASPLFASRAHLTLLATNRRSDACCYGETITIHSGGTQP